MKAFLFVKAYLCLKGCERSKLQSNVFQAKHDRCDPDLSKNARNSPSMMNDYLHGSGYEPIDVNELRRRVPALTG